MCRVEYMEVLVVVVVTVVARIATNAELLLWVRGLCQELSLCYLMEPSQGACEASNIILILHVRKVRPKRLSN